MYLFYIYMYPSGAPKFIPGFSGVRITRSLILCMFCRGQVVIPTAHFSDIHSSDSPLLRRHIIPTAHFSDNHPNLENQMVCALSINQQYLN
jgi:hypothetical protein